MTSEWWVERGLRDAGMSKNDARCVVRGVRGNLAREEIDEIRRTISGLEPMPDVTDVDALLALSRRELAPEVHHVLAHYIGHCRHAPERVT